MATTFTPERVADVAKLRSGRLRLLWILALVAVVGAGVVLWLVFAGDGEPTATFDGETATYRGSETFEAGDVTISLDATAYEPDVMFLVARLADDSMTIEDLEVLAEEYPASVEPPGVFTDDDTSTVITDEVVEHEFTMTEGRWLLAAATAPDGTDRVFPAAILEVTAAE